MKLCAKYLLLLATLSLAACGRGDTGSAFDDFLGDYTVLSQPGTEGGVDTCPLTDATLKQGEFEGHQAIVLEARGETNGCHATQTSVLNVTGMKGVECEGSRGFSRCARGGDRFEARAKMNGDVLTLDLENTGSFSSRATWILRRK